MLSQIALTSLFLAGSCFVPHSARAAKPQITRTMEHGSRTRTYHVILPDGHDPSKPTALVLVLHGGGGEGSKMDHATLGQFSREADRKGWIVVLPDGVDKGWNDGREATSNPRRDVDDVAFLAALIDEVSKSYAIDARRVYATGISNGGFMSILLALRLSDRIAAVAPVTASLPKIHEHERPPRPVPILFMNGTKDPMVPYEGGQATVLGRERGEVLSTDESAAIFAGYNGCTGEAKPATLPDWAPRDGTRVIVRKASGCTAPVVLYRIEGGGHTWPGGRYYFLRSIIGRVSRDIQGARHIFDFFAKQSLPVGREE